MQIQRIRPAHVKACICNWCLGAYDHLEGTVAVGSKVRQGRFEGVVTDTDVLNQGVEVRWTGKTVSTFHRVAKIELA